MSARGPARFAPARLAPATLQEAIRRTPELRLHRLNIKRVRGSTSIPPIPATTPLLAEKDYDADWLRTDLRKSGTVPVITGTRSRKRPIRYDKLRYKDRWRAEAVFCLLKDFRRVATRYDKLARNYASAVVLVAVVVFWCWFSPAPNPDTVVP